MNDKLKRFLFIGGAVVLYLVTTYFGVTLPEPDLLGHAGAPGRTQFAYIDVGRANVDADLDVGDDITADDDLTVSGDAAITGVATLTGNLDANSDADIDGTANLDEVDIDGVLNLATELEHVGTPSILTQAITYTAGAGTSGTLATISDGEIWLIHGVFIQTTTTFTDAAGNDETFTIGDGNDADGFLSAASTQLASDFTEATGFAAGFYGIENGSQGAYTLDDGGPFVYAPSGSAETIDYELASGAGDDIGAGALTMYVVYTRIQ
jgi:hypothetical protein